MSEATRNSLRGCKFQKISRGISPLYKIFCIDPWNRVWKIRLGTQKYHTAGIGLGNGAKCIAIGLENLYNMPRRHSKYRRQESRGPSPPPPLY